MDGNINISLTTARKWYHSNDEQLKALSLEAYNISELRGWPRNVTEALDIMGKDAKFSKAVFRDIYSMDYKAGSMFYLNKVLSALHYGEERKYTYYPVYILSETAIAVEPDVMYKGMIHSNGKKLKVYSYIVCNPAFTSAPDQHLYGCSTFDQAAHLDYYFWQLILETILDDILFINNDRSWRE